MCTAGPGCAWGRRPDRSRGIRANRAFSLACLCIQDRPLLGASATRVGTSPNTGPNDQFHPNAHTSATERHPAVPLWPSDTPTPLSAARATSSDLCQIFSVTEQTRYSRSTKTLSGASRNPTPGTRGALFGRGDRHHLRHYLRRSQSARLDRIRHRLARTVLTMNTDSASQRHGHRVPRYQRRPLKQHVHAAVTRDRGALRMCGSTRC